MKMRARLCTTPPPVVVSNRTAAAAVSKDLPRPLMTTIKFYRHITQKSYYRRQRQRIARMTLRVKQRRSSSVTKRDRKKKKKRREKSSLNKRILTTVSLTMCGVCVCIFLYETYTLLNY